MPRLPGFSQQQTASQGVAAKLALHFSVVAASSACCPLPCLAWGGWERELVAVQLLWL